MEIITIIWLFILGTIFGSFGSVILTRMRYKITLDIIKGFAFGRSQCPHCKHTLSWYNLIPLYSWLRSRGKCSYCSSPISSMYPVLEFVSGIVFSLRGWVYVLPYIEGIGELSFVMLLIWRLLGLLLVRDMYTYELHVPVRFFVSIITIGYALYSLIFVSFDWNIVWYFITFLMVFLGIYYGGQRYAKRRFGRKQETFGQGDVMLAPIVGILIALQGIGQNIFLSPLIIVMLFVLGSSLIGMIMMGCVWIIKKIVQQKVDRHESGGIMLPFLPAMIITYLIFPYLLLWYNEFVMWLSF